VDIKKLVRDIASSVRGDGPYKNSDEVEVAILAFAKAYQRPVEVKK
jgi:hypothetical protein